MSEADTIRARSMHRRPGAPNRLPRALAAAILGLTLGSACLPAGPAQAQQVPAAERRSYDIPAGPLGQSLNRFASRSGITLSFDPALVQGRSAPALTGEYSVEAGLQALLAGSGLVPVPGTEGGYRLRAAGSGSEGPEQLGPIQVTSTLVGTRIGETAEESSASVQVFTAEDLEDRPATDEVRDLYEKTPNVIDFGEGNFAPAIRGVDGTGAASGGLGFIAGTRPRATLSVDGRPLSAFELVGGPTALWDVKQVEVYRGPQTTLQGRNSIAGAIQVDTNDPSFRWEGRAQVSVGTEDRRRYSGVVSGPLMEDALAFRVSVDRLDASSFVDFKGPQVVDDVEDDRSTTVRGKLRLEPAGMPELTGQLTVSHAESRRPQSQLAEAPFDERERQTSQTAFETQSTNLVLDLEYFLTDQLRLSNASTFAHIRFDRLDAPANGQFRLEGPQITNETLLNLNDAERGVKGVLGFYVFHEDRDDDGFIGTPLEFSFEDETLTTSAFGEMDWRVWRDLHLILGGRYEREERRREGSAFGIVTDLDETFDAFLPKFGLAYEFSPRIIAGATVARGFNAGGGSVSFGASDADGNASPDPALGPRSFVFDSEFVWNYELYARARLLQERLFLTANLFFSDYEDQQRVEQLDFPGGFTDSIIVNTPQTRAFGAELGASYRPWDSLELFTQVGLLETEIVEANDAALEGNDFARAPSFNANFGGQWQPGGGWTLSADGRYVSEYFSTDENNSLAEVDGYFLANVQAAWEWRRHARVFASVSNLFDSDAERRLFSFPATAPPSLANVVEPRLFWLGVELSY